MELRSYQEEAVEIILTALKNYLKAHGLLFTFLPTGSGKTLVAAEFIKEYLELSSKNIVIFLAPEWELIRQAKDEFSKLGVSDKLFRRIRGDKEHLICDLSCDMKGRVFFTTLHTWNKFDNSVFKKHRKNMVVIIDEAHWGLDKKMMTKVTAFCHDTAARCKVVVPILGFTATPRLPTSMGYKILYEISFMELVSKGYLAKPIIINVSTGVIWDPIVNNGRLVQSSLNKLNTQKRNVIVEKTVIKALSSNSERRGILFAIDIKHADTLNIQFSQGSFPCGVVNGSCSKEQNSKTINDFRTGSIRLLIVVNKHTKGFNVPEITDVFLARPCDSDAMLSQMIGRGSRIIPEVKHEFTVHDFYDTIDDSKANKIFHSSSFIGNSCSSSGSGFYNAQLTRKKHSCPDTPQVILLGKEFGSLAKIEFIDNQTFGIEIEITSKKGIPKYGTDEWNDGAVLLISALKEALGDGYVYSEGLPYHYSSNVSATHLWRIESDSSAGWEVISPILMGRADLLQIIAVCEALSKLIEGSDTFHINYTCGFHLTLATRLDDPVKRKKMIAAVSRLEPGLFTLVSPSRLFSYNAETNGYVTNTHNKYCYSINKVDIDKAIKAIEGLCDDEASAEFRYLTVNLLQTKYLNNLLEIRMHNSTVDHMKIIPWISLWMIIINHTTFNGTGDIACIDIFAADYLPEEEDIFQLLQKEGINITKDLTSILFNRRKDLSENWKLAIPKKVENWEAEGWY